MLDRSTIKYLALDADDTLWINETIFVDTQAAYFQLLNRYASSVEVFDQKLYESEKKNIQLFGYGIKGFILSMIETAIELSKGQVTAQEIQKIIDLGKEMFLHPVHLLDTVEDSVQALKAHFHLMVVTKGDLFDQEHKIARSGLAEHFEIIEVLSEKDVASYQRLLKKHNIKPAEFCMAGNSLKSDILPILQLGGQAAHIPFHTTWKHEQVEDHHLNGFTYTEFPNLGALTKDLLSVE